MRIVIVTGLAGGGKTTVLRALEDIGFFCCDNLPIPLVKDFVALLVSQQIQDCAISIDGRQLRFIADCLKEIEALRLAGHDLEVLFTEAADAVLFRRYSESRRRHPLSGDNIADGIRQDREALAPLRDQACIVDTAGLNVHEIKQIVTERYREGAAKISVSIQSFGFKYGLPSDTEVVFDVRYLPNPHFDPILGPQDGRDREVAAYVFSGDEAEETVQRMESHLRFALPLHAREGKLYLNLGVGCTGGRHRSVAIAEELARRLVDDWHVVLRHRDVSKGTMRNG